MLLLLLLSAPETKNSSNDTDSVSAYDSHVGGTNAATNAATNADPFHVHCFCFYCNKYSYDNSFSSATGTLIDI